MRLPLLLLIIVTFYSCYEPPQRDCEAFKTGEFLFEEEINGKQERTRFIRTDSLQIEYYNETIDSARVQWVNDCEFILYKINPESNAESRAIRMKILTTTSDSYTFEYTLAGNNTTARGKIKKLD